MHLVQPTPQAFRVPDRGSPAWAARQYVDRLAARRMRDTGCVARSVVSTAFEDIATHERSTAVSEQGFRELLRKARQVQRSCELLDLTALGISTCLREGKFGEAQLRADAAVKVAEDLLGDTESLVTKILDARLERVTAA